MKPKLQQFKNLSIRVIKSLPFMMTLGFIVSYLLLGYFAVNPVAQRLLPWIGENKLASQLKADKVSFDPLRLALTVDQLSLTTPEGTSLAGFERLHADLEVSGITRWSWRLKEVALSKPHLTFESRKGGGSNWSGLIAKLNETPDTEPSKGMARLLIDHLLIARGDIEYVDNNRAETFRAVLEPLDLELDGFSTLPEDLGDYAILAKLPEQGGTLKWKGELGLNPLFSNGKVELEGLRLAKLLKVLPPGTLPIRLDEGSLKTSLDYEFALKDDQPHLKVSKLAMLLEGLSATLLHSRDQAGALHLQQAQLSLPSLEYLGTQQPQLRLQDLKLALNELELSQSGVALLALPSLELDGLGLDLQQQQVDIASVKLASGKIHAVRDGNGEINWQWLQQSAQQPEQVQAASEATQSDTQQAQAAASAEQKAGFNIVLHSLALQGFALDYEDKSYQQALKLAAQDFQLNFKLAAQNGNVQVSELSSALGPLQLRSGLEKKPAATLSKIALSGGQLDLAQRKLNVEAIVLQGLQSDIIRNANGINWQNMLKVATQTASAQTQPTQVAAASEPAWSVELARLALQDGALHIADQTTPEAVKIDLEKIGLELGKLSLDTKRALPLKLAFKVKQGGSFNLDGKVTPATLNADLKVKLSELALLPFAPYVNQAAMLKLNAGQFNTAGQLSLKQAEKVEYKGGFSLDKLDITEEEGGQSFLGWHSLLSNSLTLSNHGLHMAELQIHQPKGKFIIYEDRSLNIKRIMREQGQAAEQAPLVQAAAQSAATVQNAKTQPRAGKSGKGKSAQPDIKHVQTAATKQPTEPSAAKSDFAVAVERIRIDQAQLEFADLSLRPQFGTYIHSLSGVINGLASEPRSTAQLELDGKVDEFGSARIRGALQPFQATAFTDLKLVFRNLEMNRLTPYSGKFAGRRIDAGKLSVDLEYKIKQRKLAGENKFVINKLKLGDKVDSEDAVNLPLDLAIALLEDSNGVIDLDLPVSGSLDDPEFSYGKVVWKALVNVLGKIVTSPFRALGNLLGLGSDKLDALVFDTGSAKLAPPEQEKLKALSTALAKRPNLVLSLAPVIDEKRDARALQEQYVRNQVIAKTGVKLAAGEQAGPVDLGNSRIRLALSKLTREQLTHEQLAALRNAAKAYAKDKDEQEAQSHEYAELLEALVNNTKVDAAWLPALSKARAQAVQQYLQVEQGLPADRLKLVDVKQVSATGSEVSMPLELGVAKH